MDDPIKHLQELVARITRTDPDLAAELRRSLGEGNENLLDVALDAGAADVDERRAAQENVVFPIARPAINVLNHRVVLRLDDTDARLWRTRLENAAERLEPVVRAVGRIEMENHFDHQYAGTGFLVDTDIVATNFHVAHAFARLVDGRPVFRRNLGNQVIRARIDFLEESGSPDDETFDIIGILHMQKEPDLALLQVKRVEKSPVNGEPTVLPARLQLSNDEARTTQDVVTIGYPGMDPAAGDPTVIARLFGTDFEKKRLSPGTIFGVSDTILQHDCSTLAGSSGSPVVDLDTGLVVGMHFDGQYRVGNRAIPAARIAEALYAIDRDPAQPPCAPAPAPAERAPEPPPSSAARPRRTRPTAGRSGPG